MLYLGLSGQAEESKAQMTLLHLGFEDDDAFQATAAVERAFGGALLWPDAGQAALCPPGAGVDLGEVTLGARRAVEGWDFAGAVAELRPIRDQLACVAPPVDGPSLGRAAVTLGYALFETGDVFAAKAAFVLAAGFDPLAAWDEDFPPDARQVFSAAAAEAAALDAVELRAPREAELRDGIRLDGGPVLRKDAVRPGLHHLQLPNTLGVGTLAAVRIPPEQVVELVPTEDLLRDWLSSVGSSAAPGNALGAALEADGVAEAWIVDLESGRRFRFSTETRTATEIAPLPTQTLSRDDRPRPGPGERIRGRRMAGGLVAGVGGAAAIGGFVTHGVAYSMGVDEVWQPRYEWARSTNTAGFAIGMIGVATAAAGVLVALLPPPRGASVSLIPGPVPTLTVSF